MKAEFVDFLAIGALLLFSALQNHGLNVLSFLSTTVQRSPHAPLGWSVLHRKNGRAILLSVYTNDGVENIQQEPSTQGTRHLFKVIFLRRCLFWFHCLLKLPYSFLALV